MTVSRRRADLDDDRLKAAVAFGFGLTNEKTAEFAGVSVSTIKRWKDDPEIKRVGSVIDACQTVAKSLAIKDSVSDVVSSAEDRIKAVFDRSLKLTERAIKNAEDAGNDLSLAELMEIHNKITIWASKYAASEAPKRMQYEGSVQHAHVHVVGFAEARRMLETAKEIDSAIGQHLIAGDAEVIADA